MRAARAGVARVRVIALLMALFLAALLLRLLRVIAALFVALLTDPLFRLFGVRPLLGVAPRFLKSVNLVPERSFEEL